MHDDTFNYSVIKLIVSIPILCPGYKLPTRSLQVALNEEFMVAGLGEEESKTIPEKKAEEAPEPKNRIIRVMMRRLGSCRTFGENMVFMLNRASESYFCTFYCFSSFSLERSHDDYCVKLLILKMLYLIFSTNGTSQYFYTNDLCVLMDVFLRELADLDEESESVCFLSFCYHQYCFNLLYSSYGIRISVCSILCWRRLNCEIYPINGHRFLWHLNHY